MNKVIPLTNKTIHLVHHTKGKRVLTEGKNDRGRQKVIKIYAHKEGKTCGTGRKDKRDGAEKRSKTLQ